MSGWHFQCWEGAVNPCRCWSEAGPGPVHLETCLFLSGMCMCYVGGQFSLNTTKILKWENRRNQGTTGDQFSEVLGTGFHAACRVLSPPLEGTLITLKAIAPRKNGLFLSGSPQKCSVFTILCVSASTLKVCFESNNTLQPSQVWGNSCCKLSTVPACLCFINEMWL